MIYRIPNEYRSVLLSSLPLKGSLIIFGASVIGIIIHELLVRAGREVLCFCDNDRSKHGSELLGKRIISVNELKEKHEGHSIIIAARAYANIFWQLKTLHIEQVYNGAFLLDQADLSGIQIPMEHSNIQKPLNGYIHAIYSVHSKNNCMINALEIVVTQKCTLKCRDCSNLMQYYSKPKHCNMDVMIKSLDCIMGNIDKVMEFRLSGGEPFLNKELPFIINTLSLYKNYDFISIFTNGTLFPDHLLWDSLTNHNVILHITDYGNGLSKKSAEVAAYCAKHGIPFSVVSCETWRDYNGFEFHNRSKEELADTFKTCCVSDVFTLLNGKLYRCPFSANADALHAIPKFKDDFLKVSHMRDRKKSVREIFFDFINHKDYINACNYCFPRGVDRPAIQAAMQVNDHLQYVHRR